MFKQSLICAVAVGMMGVATSAFAAIPAVPSPAAMKSSTAVTNPSIGQAAYWFNGRSYPYRWRGSYYHHRRRFGSGWRYW